MGTGWLKKEIEVIEKEVSTWPEWKKAIAIDEPENQHPKQSAKEIPTNLQK